VSLDAIPREALFAVAAVSLLYAIVLAAARAFKRFERRLTFAAARRGEKEARALLVAHGYDVLGEQVTTTYTIEVDREPIAITLSADYLVRRGGRRFVAEVKTGEVAPRIETRATRRQLLEYRVAFDAAGVLLVDMGERTVREVVFPLPPPPRNALGWVFVVALVAITVTMALR
jgi:hypothetical protein